MSPHCRQHYMSSRHGSERPVQKLNRKFFAVCVCGRRLNVSFILLEPLVALTMNFINDRLLFINFSISLSFGRVL
jgi:hypothetical protein